MLWTENSLLSWIQKHASCLWARLRALLIRGKQYSRSLTCELTNARMSIAPRCLEIVCFSMETTGQTLSIQLLLDSIFPVLRYFSIAFSTSSAPRPLSSNLPLLEFSVLCRSAMESIYPESRVSRALESAHTRLAGQLMPPSTIPTIQDQSHAVFNVAIKLWRAVFDLNPSIQVRTAQFAD